MEIETLEHLPHYPILLTQFASVLPLRYWSVRRCGHGDELSTLVVIPRMSLNDLYSQVHPPLYLKVHHTVHAV